MYTTFFESKLNFFKSSKCVSEKVARRVKILKLPCYTVSNIWKWSYLKESMYSWIWTTLPQKKQLFHGNRLFSFDAFSLGSYFQISISKDYHIYDNVYLSISSAGSPLGWAEKSTLTPKNMTMSICYTLTISNCDFQITTITISL